MTNRYDKIENILGSYIKDDEDVTISDLNLEDRTSFGTVNIGSNDVNSFNNFIGRYQTDKSVYPNGILLSDNPKKIVNDEDIKYKYVIKYNKNRVNERHEEMFPSTSTLSNRSVSGGSQQQLFTSLGSSSSSGNSQISNKTSKKLFIQILVIVSIVFVIIYFIKHFFL